MIAFATTNSLQERFLADFANQVVWGRNNDTQRLCCWFRFHPQHQEKTNTEVAAEIRKQLNGSFPSTNMPATLAAVVKKIKEQFGEKMQADGVAVDLLQRERGWQPQQPTDKYPWQIIYQWLWDIEFPRRGWQLAQEIATCAIDELQMTAIDKLPLQRRLDLDEIETCEKTIRKGERYALGVNLGQDGYLLLVNQSQSGETICLCPSRAYRLAAQFLPDRPLYLPQLNAPGKSLRFTEVGEEYFLAIVTEKPLNLSWVSPDSPPKDILVDEQRLREIFMELGKQCNGRVYYKKFLVTE
ncbi:DUF4384 domain-containing protein [Phormidium sp. CCY1219]|uniref:DUF4384 domain-containing protein n=1 Tax=Phormidium sp. CCY1219 TaxID=2886104 RepID=UPI002D1F7FD4|nr:DUF4384 domain-containing protein [Phormidium sp. CCY1219]MEB3829091.1 DUF4384 domain-containing protein [Phormidium sp. CCY1219]